MSVNECDIDYKISQVNMLVSINEDQLHRMILAMERLKRTLRDLAKKEQHTR